MSAVNRWEIHATAFSDFFGRHKAAFFICYSILYFTSTIWLASAKHFWTDELYTYYLSQLPRLSDLWTSLRQGFDSQPLPFYLATRVALLARIDVHVAARLPEIFGFWLMSIFVFQYVARRIGPLYGAVAMFGPFLTNAYTYAYEARPYALVLGFCAATLYCWQCAIDKRWRPLALAGLGLSIAAAASSHYYAILIPVSLAAAELVRTFHRRRVDWLVWVSVGAGASVAFLYLPVVMGSIGAYKGRHWASPGRISIVDLYLGLFGYAILPLLALLAVVTAYFICESRYNLNNSHCEESPSTSTRQKPAGRLIVEHSTGGPPDRERSGWGIPAHEIAAGLALLLVPLLGYGIGVAITNVVAPRYFIIAVIGFSVLLTYAGFRATCGSSLLGIAWLAISLAAFCAGGIFVGAREFRNRDAQTYVLRTLLSSQPGALPVAVDDPLIAFPLFHYERQDITSRLYFVADLKASLRYGEIPYPQCEDWLQRRRVYPVQAERLSAFQERWKRFLFYSTGSKLSYLLPKLLADGSMVTVVATKGAHRLYLVDGGSR